MKLLTIALVLFAATGCKPRGASKALSNSENSSPPSLNLGSFKVIDHDSPYIIAAPHADYDDHTGEMVERVCLTLKWDCVFAWGYRTLEHPYNVNRPSEGIGLPSKDEIHSPESAEVYDAYKAQVDQINPFQTRRLYVEIHGNSRPPSASNIEVAVVNIDKAQAQLVKSMLEQKLATHGLQNLSEFGFPRMNVLVEGVDTMTFLAGGVKSFGILKDFKGSNAKALHFEFAKVFRDSKREATIEFLIDALQTYTQTLPLTTGE